jgi:tight adherence protein C
MSETALLLTFFATVLAGAVIGGYVFVLRPASARAESAPLPADLTAAAEGGWLAGFFIATFRRMGEVIPGARDVKGELPERLSQVGYRFPGALSVFYGVKCAASLLAAVTAGFAASLQNPDPGAMLLPMLCGAGFGFKLPDLVLGRLAKARKERLRRGLPAALDLMVLGIEAGQAMDQAILDTSRGLQHTHPDLSHEFTRLHLELRAANSRVDALRAFGERNGEPELRKVGALLIDTDRFGTSLGPALRTHARYLRIRFRQTAQERARKVGVKLIFPVFFLIFPSVILVTLGPAVILIMTSLKKMMNGF